MVERIALCEPGWFQPKDVPALHAIFQREQNQLFWSGREALAIAISRLLPAASPGDLDDPETRDGLLRLRIINDTDVFTRGYVARELVASRLAGQLALPSRHLLFREGAVGKS